MYLLQKVPRVMAGAFFLTQHPMQLKNELSIYLHAHSHFINHCQMWTGQKDNYGYGVHRVKSHGKMVKLQVHRLAYFLSDPSHLMQRSFHVSHLCHNKLCINIAHLSYESPAINNARQICRADGQCTGHWGHKKCMLEMVIIQHCFCLQFIGSFVLFCSRSQPITVVAGCI
jgi:hypothetical protein